jgi:hypothetical protein
VRSYVFVVVMAVVHLYFLFDLLLSYSIMRKDNLLNIKDRA